MLHARAAAASKSYWYIYAEAPDYKPKTLLKLDWPTDRPCAPIYQPPTIWDAFIYTTHKSIRPSATHSHVAIFGHAQRPSEWVMRLYRRRASLSVWFRGRRPSARHQDLPQNNGPHAPLLARRCCCMGKEGYSTLACLFAQLVFSQNAPGGCFGLEIYKPRVNERG
jgi:hypothetical protein